MNNGLYKKLKNWARNYFRKPLIYYYFKNNKQNIQAPKNENVVFSIIDTWGQFQNEANKYKIECDQDLEKRFKEGAKIALVRDDKSIFSMGWLISDCLNFQITYNKNKLFIGKSVVALFDFQTFDEHRKKGYYQTLLVKILEEFKGYDFLIYTSPTNVGSHKGITSAGFVELGPFLKINNRKLFKKFMELGIDIKKGRSK